MFRTASITLGLAAALTLSGCVGIAPPAGPAAPDDAAADIPLDRPPADGRGVISYPSYQVALARRGDTVADVAERVGVDPARLAGFNGLKTDTIMRPGELLALPPRTAGTGGRAVEDVTALAGAAIERSGDTSPVTSTDEGPEGDLDAPVRHKAVRGETVYSISRLYNVPVRSLADWNGLGPDLRIREGQHLIIPASAGVRVVADTALPGEGTSIVTPPPSASRPLPRDVTVETAPIPPSPNLGSAPSAAGGMLWPVSGKVIRDFAKGRTDGIDIAAPAGASIRAADDGTVAAITHDTDQVPIVVVRHADNLLSVYANIADISVEKGERVFRGQNIAKVREGDPSFLYFEVRRGFESVDPNDFLN